MMPLKNRFPQEIQMKKPSRKQELKTLGNRVKTVFYPSVEPIDLRFDVGPVPFRRPFTRRALARAVPVTASRTRRPCTYRSHCQQLVRVRTRGSNQCLAIIVLSAGSPVDESLADPPSRTSQKGRKQRENGDCRGRGKRSRLDRCSQLGYGFAHCMC